MTLRRKAAAAAVAATLALAVAGCGDADSPSRDVTVVGKGEVKGAPDVLRADVGVSVTAPDVSGAMSKANDKARAVIDAVTGAGVAKEDVQTSELSVNPQYAQEPGKGPTITDYNVTNSVRIVVRDLSKASDVLDKGVRAGGDDARLSNVAFDLENDAELVKSARERAFNDAKSRAEQYADLSGSRLGEVIRIDETHGATPPPAPRIAFKAPQQASAVPIEPGQETVSFTVTVIWELR